MKREIAFSNQQLLARKKTPSAPYFIQELLSKCVYTENNINDEKRILYGGLWHES